MNGEHSKSDVRPEETVAMYAPWRAAPYSSIVGCGVVGKRGMMIASIPGPKEHAEPIARLIAEAPELLKALEDICAHEFTYVGTDADTGNPSSLYNAVNRGRALLLILAGAATGSRIA